MPVASPLVLPPLVPAPSPPVPRVPPCLSPACSCFRHRRSCRRLRRRASASCKPSSFAAAALRWIRWPWSSFASRSSASGTARSRSPSSNFTSYVPSRLSMKILLPLYLASTSSPMHSSNFTPYVPLRLSMKILLPLHLASTLSPMRSSNFTSYVPSRLSMKI